ncbi:hypothetical protein J7J83_03330 [bacterium]|nr:hypothetical protein [bacterium]
MKKYLSISANIILILIGLLGLHTPYVVDFVIAIGLGGFMDNALLQPLFIGFVILAIYAQFNKAKETLSFMPLILEFVVGIVAFLFIFPFKNLIVGYISLGLIVYLMIAPVINKQLQKKKVVKIKA